MCCVFVYKLDSAIITYIKYARRKTGNFISLNINYITNTLLSETNPHADIKNKWSYP